MSVGGIFLLAAFVLWFLLGIGVRAVPGAEDFAHASFVLGILLSGVPFNPWGRVP